MVNISIIDVLSDTDAIFHFKTREHIVIGQQLANTSRFESIRPGFED
jgi:hypothetical protein